MAAAVETPPLGRRTRRLRWPLRWQWLAPLGVYAALLAAHASLLRLPYYWDEAGYYIFAALDCFRHGELIPHSTLANGHPPLLSLYLALVWSLAGFHIAVTRLAMLAWAAALVCGVYALAKTRLGARAAMAPALLVALAPLVFAQSSLALLDLPVAALIIWALVARRSGQRWSETGLFVAACLMKETAVIVPGVLLLYEFFGERRRGYRYLAPIAVLAVWYVYYHAHTGYWFGNPQYFAYNLSTTAVSLPRIALSLVRRIWQLAFYDGTGFLTLLAAAGYWIARRRGLRRERWPAAWMLVIGVYLLFHAAVGGAVLARYLLPALALYLIGLSELLLTLPRAGWWVAACAAVLIASWFWNPPYPFPYEDNLAYAHFIRLHQAAARELEAQPPSGPIVTVWPATDELTRPALGYVTHALAVDALPNFSRTSLAALASLHATPAALYLYSRTYQPALNVARDAPFWLRWAHRYFDFARPAPPAAWLARLHLHAVFERSAAGQWVLLACPVLSSPASAARAAAAHATARGSPGHR
ncbi:MAG: ArnT family glycosyltransferase [Terriglobales bacterium]